MTKFQQKVKESLDFDPAPGIDMLVTREGVDPEELKHYILVKFFTEGDDTLKLLNVDALMAVVSVARQAESDEERLGAFQALMFYLNWLVYPIEYEMEEMLRKNGDIAPAVEKTASTEGS